MKKIIYMAVVCVLAVSAGFAAGSLNSSAHFFDGGTHHNTDCAVGNPVTGIHHSENCSNLAGHWEQCIQEVHHPESIQEEHHTESSSTGSHHTESRRGHGGHH